MFHLAFLVVFGRKICLNNLAHSYQNDKDSLSHVSAQLSPVFEELSPALEAVLAQGHPGVVIALVGACRRIGTHQAQVLQLLLEVSGSYLELIHALGSNSTSKTYRIFSLCISVPKKFNAQEVHR